MPPCVSRSTPGTPSISHTRVKRLSEASSGRSHSNASGAAISTCQPGAPGMSASDQWFDSHARWSPTGSGMRSMRRMPSRAKVSVMASASAAVSPHAM